MLAVAIDSVGHYEFYNRLFEKIGISNNNIMKQFLLDIDYRKQWRGDYNHQPNIKRKRASKLVKKLFDGKKKLSDENKKI